MEPEERVLSILGRRRHVFAQDLARHEAELAERIGGRSFLVLGGAGSIGQAVVQEIFRRRPRRLHVVDISENNLVELVRDLRSSWGYIDGDFQTLPLDCGELELEMFLQGAESYDCVLNFSAMKHVRSEKDGYTLMRMVRTNVLNTWTTLGHAIAKGAGAYFAVSSDKAANPANAMGATKRAMELCLLRASDQIRVSSARFANVAFSDGSLLHGFTHRLAKRQPLAAPVDVRRYFITARESAILCLIAAVMGGNREAAFPRITEEFQALDFRSLAERFLELHGYQPHPCDTEDEARSRVEELAAQGSWPCYFFTSDTTGEKSLEEFHLAGETVDIERYREIGVVRWPPLDDGEGVDRFLEALGRMRRTGSWTREKILDQLKALLPEFRHQETGKFLDGRM